MCGKLVNSDGTVLQRSLLVNNAICHMFEEIRYEINAIEINKCKNVGLKACLIATEFSAVPTTMFLIKY